MTTQTVIGSVRFSDGTVGLFNGANGAGGTSTDGTLTEIKSDSTFYVVSSSAGNQFPNKVITHASFSGATFLQYAYVLSREGTVAALLPVMSRASMNDAGMLPLCKPYQFKSGDTIQTMTRA